MTDWLNPISDGVTVCRPALPKDTAEVLAFTRLIWEGEDYIHEVWEGWLWDPHGLLAVAEFGGHVAGIGKLSCLAEGEWWLEGLRVAPQVEGRGIASHLHDYLLAHWQRYGSGVIRLATGSTRYPVHHLCERSGFRRVIELARYTAQTVAGETGSLRPVRPEELSAGVDFVLGSPVGAIYEGLLEADWHWGRAAIWNLLPRLQEDMLWWWLASGGSEKCLAAGRESDDGRQLRLVCLAGPWEALSGCLSDLRFLAEKRGYEKVGWWASADPRAFAALGAAGYERDGEHSLLLFEKMES